VRKVRAGRVGRTEMVFLVNFEVIGLGLGLFDEDR
jgi:hypothetical protein